MAEMDALTLPEDMAQVLPGMMNILLKPGDHLELELFTLMGEPIRVVEPS